MAQAGRGNRARAVRKPGARKTGRQCQPATIYARSSWLRFYVRLTDATIRTAAWTILWAGLVAGALDITDALVFYGLRGARPIVILQSIASGLLGRAAFKGGVATAILGGLLHFFIAFTASAVFYAAARTFDFLRRHAVIWGLLYGGAVYLVMNWIVVPLSAVPKPRPAIAPIPFINGVLAVVLLVGLPISLIVNRGLRR